MTDSYLVLKTNSSGIFKINSWYNGPFWGQNVNDNEFRGDLKIRFNPNTQRLWVINQLPMENYIKGIVEVGDSANSEFLKAQMIAARTYALFRYLTPKYTNAPNNENFFTVRATQADQVYRGYLGELRTPNASLAAENTKGIVATYQGEPILAYYFAQSDGSTRDSQAVNMTTAPVDYLKAKNDPPGQGKTLLGHGVGLPQISGMTAANQGANYSQILKYYYTGIDLTKMY
jgi:stage II sporulation protein D